MDDTGRLSAARRHWPPQRGPLSLVRWNVSASTARCRILERQRFNSALPEVERQRFNSALPYRPVGLTSRMSSMIANGAICASGP